MKVIFFNTIALGDFLIHSKALHDLKRKTNCRIVAVCSPYNSRIISNENYIDEIIIYNKKWNFFKKIRCFQYTQKYKSFEFKKDQIESEIIQYIENLYNQYKICKKIININLDIIDQVHINNEQDFLLFLHDEFQLNVHDSFNIKNNEKEDFINIFKNNIMHFNYIKF